MRNAAAIEMRDGVGDRPIPFEAQIAVAGRNRQPRHFGGLYARPVHIELLVAEAIGVAHRPGDELGAHHRWCRTRSSAPNR